MGATKGPEDCSTPCTARAVMPAIPLPQIIMLNGTSSSGKTSIAHCLQEALSVVYLNFSIDAVLYALPPSDLQAMIDGRKIQRGDYAYDRLVRGFHAAIAGLAATGNRLIVDNALTQPAWRQDFDTATAPYDVVRIGVFCDLAVARQREIARGDRAVGTAEAEYGLVHAQAVYDLTVNTTACAPAEAATTILYWLKARDRSAAISFLPS